MTERKGEGAAYRQVGGNEAPGDAIARGDARVQDERERVSQADRPDLRLVVPTPHNLPPERTSLVGREEARAAVADMLRRPVVSLVTLTGIGGVGKTRLALAVAADLLADFPDGVWFVDLSQAHSTEQVAMVVAESAHVIVRDRLRAVDELRGVWRNRRVLLVLDNFEHVARSATLVAELLASSPGLRVLAAARAPLNLYGEQEVPVPVLPVPDLCRTARHEPSV